MKSKRRAKLIRDRIFVYVIASALLFVLICAIGVGIAFLTLKLPTISLPEEYTVYYGSEKLEKDDMESATYKIGEVADNRTVYVNFSVLAEYGGFYVSGDKDRLRYILPTADGTEDSQFVATDDSNEIDLNGTVVHLSSPAVIREEQLYLPIEFVDFYIQGISVLADEEEENAYILKFDDGAEFYLIASPQQPTEPIDRSALDE